MSTKFTLTNAQIQELVYTNKYKVDEKTMFTARCIDGRYENSTDLPAMAVPGADAGELAVLYAAANQYGFELHYETAFSTMLELLGKNAFNMHTDAHGDTEILASGCGHIKQIRLDPLAYSLDKPIVEILNKHIDMAKEKGGNQVMLRGDRQEGAVLLINGNYGVLPQFVLEAEFGRTHVQVFEYHKTLANARHRQWAKLLVGKKAVTLLDGLDEDYLYEAISEIAENHLFETAKRLAINLPIFEVTFKDNGDFIIEDRGFVY